MKSKYQRAIVFDLETGGFSTIYNMITEAAFVVVDLEKLEIIEENVVTFEPRLDLSWRSEPIKDAKILYKNLGIKDIETNIKTLNFKEHKITLKNLDPLINEITEFYNHLDNEVFKDIFNLKDLEFFEENSHFSEIVKIFLNNCYNPQALEVTHISLDMLKNEGIDYESAYNKTKGIIDKHTVGNNKPIMVGHNTGSLPRRIIKGKEVGPDGFDHPFMEKLFKENNDDWFYSINDDIIDTIKWARLKWSELSNYTLGTCANEVGLTLKEAHRALPDTVANAKFFIKMMQHLRGEGSLKSRYKRRKFNVQI